MPKNARAVRLDAIASADSEALDLVGLAMGYAELYALVATAAACGDGAIDAIDAHAHGKPDVMLYVLSRPYTYCGETNIERLALTF